MKTDWTKDIEWCKQMFMYLAKYGQCPTVYHDLPGDGALRLLGNGDELVLLPNGHWFMNDTSGG